LKGKESKEPKATQKKNVINNLSPNEIRATAEHNMTQSDLSLFCSATAVLIHVGGAATGSTQ
jgi:hypothetical protein